MKNDIKKTYLASVLAACAMVSQVTSAATDKSGTITDETWTAAMSPIRIVGDITVAKLTIEPGVEILFTGNYEFQCPGVFRAEGEEGNPISFHGDTGVTWKGILFQDSSPGSALEWCVIEDSNDHGLQVRDSLLSIRNCTFRNNLTPDSEYGGGLQVSLQEAGTLIIEKCVFKANTAKVGGGAEFSLSDADAFVRLSDCVFSENIVRVPTGAGSAWGGGIAFLGPAGRCELLRCIFDSNLAWTTDNTSESNYTASGGGMYNQLQGPVSLRNCIFINNIARSDGSNWGDVFGGGLSLNGSSASNLSIQNSVFEGNSLETPGPERRWGGGLRLGAFQGTPTVSISSCTVANNSEFGVLNSAQAPTILSIKNSMIYANNNSSVQVSGSASISYSDIQGGYAGTGNINQSPIFRPDGTVPDPWPWPTPEPSSWPWPLRLNEFSAGIDAGNPDPSYNDLCFYDATDAPWGSLGGARNDMGAYGGPGACLWEPGSIPLTLSLPTGGGIVGVGDVVTLSIQAGGIGPFEFVWKKNGVVVTDVPGHISGANTASLTITGATGDDAGNYTVDVTNALGDTMTSSVVPLAIDPLRVKPEIMARVKIQAEIGKTVRVEYTNDLTSGSWIMLWQGVVTQSPYFYYDDDSVGQPKRFYRASEVTP